MYKYMYIRLNVFYFFKYPEYNFITIAYLYSAVVGHLTEISAVVGPVRLRRNLCVPTQSGRNLCASGVTCPPMAEPVRLWRIASAVVGRLTNNLFRLPKHFFLYLSRIVHR